MPTFSYLGIDAAGQEVTGTVRADTLSFAVNQVRRLGYFPTNVSEEGERATDQATAGSGWLVSIFGKTFRKDPIALLTRELANLVGSGLSLSFSLSILYDRQEGGVLKSAIWKLREDVNHGLRLSEALDKHTELFDQVYVSVVRAGEKHGKLDAALRNLADLEEKRQALSEEVRRALKRALMLIVAACNVFTYLFIIVLPTVSETFFGFIYCYANWKPGEILLFSIRKIIIKSYFVVLGCIVGTAIGVRLASHISRLKAIKDRIVLKLPFTGKLVRTIAVTQFTRTFAVLLNSGIPALESYHLARGRVSNGLIADAIEKAHVKSREEESFAHLLERSGAFPSTAVNMIAVGESTGNLGFISTKVADFYESEAHFHMRRAQRALMFALVSVAAGVIALIIITALVQRGVLSIRFPGGT